MAAKRKAEKNTNGADPPIRFPAERVQQLNVAKLFPYARNARLHTNEQIDKIADAIKRFGVTNPVIVDARGEIIAGHGRVMAARRLGMKTFPGIVIADGEWSPENVRAYRIWDNQSGLLAEWSPELIKLELSDLKFAGYDLSITGFDPDSLVSYMANLNGPTPPGEFPAVGENVATEHSCPSCGYRWSGKADAAPRPEAAKEGAD